MNLIDRVVNAIFDNVYKCKQFTILDISNQVKLDGGDFVKHSEIRDVAKPIIQKILIDLYNDYECKAIKVQTLAGPSEAILYYPSYSDPSKYCLNMQTALSPVATKVKDTTVKIPSVTGSTSSMMKSQASLPSCVNNAISYIEVLIRKSDGALQIPRYLLYILNYQAYDVIIHKNSISLVEGTDKSSTKEIRISKMQLKEVGLDSYDSLVVCAFSNKIVICK